MSEASSGFGTAFSATALTEEPLLVRTVREVVKDEEQVIALVAALRAAGYPLEGS